AVLATTLRRPRGWPRKEESLLVLARMLRLHHCREARPLQPGLDERGRTRRISCQGAHGPRAQRGLPTKKAHAAPAWWHQPELRAPFLWAYIVVFAMKTHYN